MVQMTTPQAEQDETKADLVWRRFLVLSLSFITVVLLIVFIILFGFPLLNIDPGFRIFGIPFWFIIMSVMLLPIIILIINWILEWVTPNYSKGLVSFLTGIALILMIIIAAEVWNTAQGTEVRSLLSLIMCSLAGTAIFLLFTPTPNNVLHSDLVETRSNRLPNWILFCILFW